MNKKREKKITSAIADNGFTFKDRHYKPISTRSLLILEQFESPFFEGTFPVKSLLDMLYISTHDAKECALMTKEQWNEAVSEFGDEFTPHDLELIGEIVRGENEKVASTVVDVKESGEKKST